MHSHESLTAEYSVKHQGTMTSRDPELNGRAALGFHPQSLPSSIRQTWGRINGSSPRISKHFQDSSV